MKICLMNNLYKPYQRGGAEMVVETMINDLQKKGHEVFLISTEPKKNKITSDDNINTYRLASRYYHLNKISPVFRLCWHLNNVFGYRKVKSIKKILTTEKPDLIITHNLIGLGFQIPKVIKSLGIKHHHFLHDIQLLHPSGLMFCGQERKINSLPSKVYQAINRKLFSSVHKVISPSKWLLDEHSKRDFFSQSIQELRPFKKSTKNKERENLNKFPEKTFVFVGQIEKHKGVLLLINAFKDINKPSIKLTVVGDGKKLEECKKMAKDDKRIEFTGRKEGTELEEIMKQSHYLIVPSLCYENSPTIINQAQALSLPVLAANIGGIPEIIEETDTLFKPNDKEDLIKKIREVV